MPTHINHRTRHSIGGDRDEEPRAACRDNIWPFDEMREHRETSKAYATAHAIAFYVCKGCPLRSTCEFAIKWRAT